MMFRSRQLVRAVSLLLLAGLTACETNSSDVLLDQDGHWLNDFKRLFRRTGARAPEWSIQNRERLAVFYNAHRGWAESDMSEDLGGTPRLLHSRLLNCSVQRVFEMIGRKTAVDVILVAPPKVIYRDGFPDWLARWKRLFVYPQIDVEAPPSITGPVRMDQYIRVNSWRTTHQFHIARALGYRYILQHDDDAYELQEFEWDLVEVMKENLMGGYCRHCFRELFYIARGGAELMRFFLISRQMHENPPGDVLTNHSHPPNISGLYTWQLRGWNDTAAEQDPNPRGGWDTMQLAGNWNLFDVDWWFSETVSNFIRLVIESDMMFNARWNDLMPESMLEQMLVPIDKFWMPPEGYATHVSHWHGVPGFCLAQLGITAEDAQLSTINGAGVKLLANGQVATPSPPRPPQPLRPPHPSHPQAPGQPARRVLGASGGIARAADDDPVDAARALLGGDEGVFGGRAAVEAALGGAEGARAWLRHYEDSPGRAVHSALLADGLRRRPRAAGEAGR